MRVAPAAAPRTAPIPITAATNQACGAGSPSRVSQYALTPTDPRKTPGRARHRQVDAAAMATSMMEIRQKLEALPEHLRPQAEQAGRSMFQSAFRARIDTYFELPPEKRQAEIDRQIDQEEMMRKAFEAGRTIAGALGGGRAETGTGSQAGATASAPSAPQRPGGSRSEEERNRWRKSMIDRTTPQERARYTEWRRAIDARREQRGLPSGWSR